MCSTTRACFPCRKHEDLMWKAKSSKDRLPTTSATERADKGALRLRFEARRQLISSAVQRRSEACTFGCEMRRYLSVGHDASMAFTDERTCELLCSWLFVTDAGLSRLFRTHSVSHLQLSDAYKR